MGIDKKGLKKARSDRAFSYYMLNYSSQAPVIDRRGKFVVFVKISLDD